jgi:two-component system chemotaxis response regulator CheY
MKTVLAVDDSASMRQMVRLTLSGAGYAVVEADDGTTGLAQAAKVSASLVITDLNMPSMNGLDFIRALRQLQSYRGVPVVILTTESEGSLKAEAKASGATAWITKPFKQEQLLALTRKLLG